MTIPKDFAPHSELLRGRVILVTGASSGLGSALAVETARAGATVILCGRNQAKLDSVYDEIEALAAPRPAIARLDLEKATADDYDRLAGTVGAAVTLGFLFLPGMRRNDTAAEGAPPGRGCT